MQKNRLHPQAIGDFACVLSTRGSVTAQRVLNNVIAFLHGNFLDRRRHVFDSDVQEAFCDLFRGADITILCLDTRG